MTSTPHTHSPTRTHTRIYIHPHTHRRVNTYIHVFIRACVCVCVFCIYTYRCTIIYSCVCVCIVPRMRYNRNLRYANDVLPLNLRLCMCASVYSCCMAPGVPTHPSHRRDTIHWWTPTKRRIYHIYISILYNIHKRIYGAVYIYMLKTRMCTIFFSSSRKYII